VLRGRTQATSESGSLTTDLRADAVVCSRWERDFRMSHLGPPPCHASARCRARLAFYAVYDAAVTPAGQPAAEGKAAERTSVDFCPSCRAASASGRVSRSSARPGPAAARSSAPTARVGLGPAWRGGLLGTVQCVAAAWGAPAREARAWPARRCACGRWLSLQALRS
jgi:hypothetical protein